MKNLTFKQLLAGGIITLLAVLASIAVHADQAENPAKTTLGTTLCSATQSNLDFEKFLGFAPMKFAETISPEMIRECSRLTGIAHGRGYQGVLSFTQQKVVNNIPGYEVCVSFRETMPRPGTPVMDHFHLAFADVMSAAEEANGNRFELRAMRVKIEELAANLPPR